MNILLDTNTLIWLVIDSKKLSAKAQKLFKNPNNKAYLSVVSHWELTVKYNLKKLHLPDKPNRFISKTKAYHNYDILELKTHHVAKLQNLKNIHKDPFDRMLVCQALADNLTILTPDKLITQYQVKTTW